MDNTQVSPKVLEEFNKKLGVILDEYNLTLSAEIYLDPTNVLKARPTVSPKVVQEAPTVIEKKDGKEKTS